MVSILVGASEAHSKGMDRMKRILYLLAGVGLVMLACGSCGRANNEDLGEADVNRGEVETKAPSAAAPAASELVPAGEVRPIVLDNGLTLLLKENHVKPVVTIRIFVQAGSMLEDELLGSGVSHLLEHLVHGGTTTTRAEEESTRLLDSIGSQSNASTWTDWTQYYIDTASSYFDQALELLADWMQNCAFTDKEFARELKVVQQEMRDGLKDPHRVFYQLSMNNLFKTHLSHLPIIGYLDIFQQLTKEQVVAYYRRMYSPGNMVLVAVGDFDSKEVLAKIEKAFANFKRRPILLQDIPQELPQLSPRTALKQFPVALTYLRLDYHTVPLSHPDLYPLDVLSYILSNGNASRLVRIIRDEKQVVHSVHTASVTPHYGGGYFMIYAIVSPNKEAEAQAAILQELARAKEELVGDEELERAKRQKISDYYFDQQTVEQQAMQLVFDYLSTHDPNFSRHYVKNIQEVTAADIQRVAREYFQDEQLCLTVMKPVGADKELTTAPEAGRRTEVQKFVLDNGLKLLVKRNPHVPVVFVGAYFLAGVRVEDDSNSGIGNLMATLLLRGTKTRSAVEIASAFEERGGNIDAGGGNNTFYVTASVLKPDLPMALEVLSDVIQHPTFTPKELENYRRLILAAIQRQRENPIGEAQLLFHKEMFHKSPYRLSRLGEAESISRFQRADLQAFHTRYARSNNVVLAVFGDVEVDRTRALVEKYFGDLKAGNPSFPEVQTDPSPTEDRRVTRTTDKQGSVIYLGYPGMTFANVSDRYPMMVLDAIISGLHLPGGWLHEELRGKGLVYVVHAFNYLGLSPGYFGIYASCAPDVVPEVLEIIEKNVAKMKAGDILEEELKEAKAICITSEELAKQSNAEQAIDATLSELYGAGYDFPEKHLKLIEQVTREEVERVANKYLTHYLCLITKPEATEADKERKSD